MPSTLFRFLAVLSLVAVAAPAQIPRMPKSTREIDRFKLYDECRPIGLMVFAIGDTQGVTKDRLQVAAESRLRAAGLYSETVAPSVNSALSLSVEASGRVFSVSVRFRKLVSDVYGLSWGAPTWELSGNGTHGGRPSFIMENVRTYLDEFFVEYLRVNARACGGGEGFRDSDDLGPPRLRRAKPVR